jgi:hypothetical protein
VNRMSGTFISRISELAGQLPDVVQLTLGMLVDGRYALCTLLGIALCVSVICSIKLG